MADDGVNKELQRALGGVAVTEPFIAQQLRAMAYGEGRYECFTYTPWRIKQIWLAAADIIEERL